MAPRAGPGRRPRRPRRRVVPGRDLVRALGPSATGAARGPATAVLAATLGGVDARVALRARGPVAPELEDICIRATALEPADRFPSVAALREAIERYLDGDRDLERRRALAEQATAAATAAAGRAAAGDANARAAALADLGVALALDPGHAGAQRQLMALLVAPPTVTPPEVERAVAARRGRHLRDPGRRRGVDLRPVAAAGAHPGVDGAARRRAAPGLGSASPSRPRWRC
jgi:hypothetical protein